MAEARSLNDVSAHIVSGVSARFSALGSTPAIFPRQLMKTIPPMLQHQTHMENPHEHCLQLRF